jgi:quercetin dioxygenase-like cupin family protein
MENTSVTALARELLEDALRAPSGRAARSVFGGQQHTLRQTVIALAAGQSLDEHENPGEATVYVLRGRVTLLAGASALAGAAGHLLTVPSRRHSLTAQEDSVVLLTTVLASSTNYAE